MGGFVCELFRLHPNQWNQLFGAAVGPTMVAERLCAGPRRPTPCTQSPDKCLGHFEGLYFSDKAFLDFRFCSFGARA